MYLWLSTEIMRISAIAIHDKLLKLILKNKAKLDNNLKDVEKKIIKNDIQVGDIKLFPIKGKKYFIFHDAYGYYEKYYELTPLSKKNYSQFLIQLAKQCNICLQED